MSHGTLDELAAAIRISLERPNCEFPFCRCRSDAPCPRDQQRHPLALIREAEAKAAREGQA